MDLGGATPLCTEQVNHTDASLSHRSNQMDLFVIIWLGDNASKDQSVICQVGYKAPTVISGPVLGFPGALEVKTKVGYAM